MYNKYWALLAFLVIALPIFSFQPDLIEKDFGNGGIMRIDVEVDCTAMKVYSTIRDNSTGATLSDVKTYLFYADYSYQLISTGKSDSTGKATNAFFGNKNILKKMFVIRIEKEGYMSKEAQFHMIKCSDKQEDQQEQNESDQQEQNQSYGNDQNDSSYIQDSNYGNGQNDSGYIQDSNASDVNHTVESEIPQNESTNQNETSTAICFIVYILVAPLFLRSH